MRNIFHRMKKNWGNKKIIKKTEYMKKKIFKIINEEVEENLQWMNE